MPNALLGWDAFPNSHKKVPYSPVSALGHPNLDLRLERVILHSRAVFLKHVQITWGSWYKMKIVFWWVLGGPETWFPGDIEVAWDRVIFEITDSPPPGTVWTHQQANLWREGSGTGTSGHSAVPYTSCGVPSSSEEWGWSWHPSCIISVGTNERI